MLRHSLRILVSRIGFLALASATIFNFTFCRNLNYNHVLLVRILTGKGRYQHKRAQIKRMWGRSVTLTTKGNYKFINTNRILWYHWYLYDLHRIYETPTLKNISNLKMNYVYFELTINKMRSKWSLFSYAFVWWIFLSRKNHIRGTKLIWCCSTALIRVRSYSYWMIESQKLSVPYLWPYLIEIIDQHFGVTINLQLDNQIHLQIIG